jgi:hypothetical protein
MRCLAEKANMFGDDAIVRTAVGDLAPFRLAAEVCHHGEINVVEGAQANKLWLATEKL